MSSLIDQQEHAYKSGHQLIAASRRLQRADQDLVDRISDMAGQLRPSETFKPYLTAYPLPSGADFVLARTWQDLDAPRSGCVRTRSLLVPMDAWLSMDGIGTLLPLLRPVTFDEKPTALVPSFSSVPVKEVSDPRKVELVEALFLEPRQPIVVFEASEAEAIVERVFAALWPGIKRSFAACTFTLAPRKIDGRDFDLSFAPKSARGRFSDWTGRRIEAVSKEVRHRWSTKIAQRIFESDQPDLRLIDQLGALQADSKGDEGALRLSLLWNELTAKARSTPSAVLGMLDILNSRGSFATHDERLSELIGSAAHRAVTGPDVADAWRFLSALAAKATNLHADMLASLDLRGLSRSLALRAPDCALEFLQSEFAAGREPMIPIIVGLGDGVGERQFDDKTSQLVLHMAPEASAAMILRSEGFAHKVWDQCRRDPLDWIPATTASIRLMERQDRAHLLHRIAPWMTARAQAPLLEATLDGVSANDLSDFAVEVGKHTGFRIAAFDEPITNAARDVESLHKLRISVVARFDTSPADRFLLSTLDFSASDVEWLDRYVPDRRRANRLLRSLIDGAPSRTLISVLRDVGSRDRILNLLMEEVAASAQQLISVVASGEFPIGRLLHVGETMLPYVGAAQREKLISHLLERAFVEAEPRDTRVQSLLEANDMSLAPRQLIHFATSPSAGTERVAMNLAVLANASQAVRRSVASAVDELSERLIRRGWENLGNAGYQAWAELILEAGTNFPLVRLRASLPTLSYALTRKQFDVSALIGATFPSVYAELLRSTGDDDFRRLPALLTLPMSFFYDWDRAKHARHELVDAYLASSWPPADLLLISMSVGIQDQTLARLAKTRRGLDYLVAIERDSHRLEPRQLSQVQKCLQRTRTKH